jgi:hypothetical protein
MRLDRGELLTVAMGAGAAAVTAAAVAVEARRRKRHRSERTARPVFEAVDAAHEAVSQALEETRVGYQHLSGPQQARFNLLTSFAVSATSARLIAFGLRSRRTVGPFRDLKISDRHIHHFVPGLLLTFCSGAAGLMTADSQRRAKLAVPFGVGLGLALDESALLLHLDDVYWSRDGLIGMQITLVAMAAMAAMSLLARAEEPAPAAAGSTARAAASASVGVF